MMGFAGPGALVGLMQVGYPLVIKSKTVFHG
jgi:hypothetical protein